MSNTSTPVKKKAGSKKPSNSSSKRNTRSVVPAVTAAKRPRMVDARLSGLLEAAADIFLEQGFDKANFNAICKRAGASKASLYSRYPTKELLFTAVIELRLDRVFAKMDLDGLSPDADLEQTLYRYGRNLLNDALSDEMIELTRIISAVAKRFPSLGQRFLQLGSLSGIRTLSAFLEAKLANGSLASVVPAQLMARQFILLTVDGLLYRKLFEEMEPQTDQAKHDQVTHAIRMFRRCYDPQQPAKPM